MINHLLSIIENFTLLIIIPTILILVMTFMSRKSKQLLVNNFGYKSQAYLGCVGIIIHEISHAVVALLFGHKIRKFKPLIIPKEDSADASLGYVEQEWNDDSLFQKLGNLPISIAPIFGCTLAIYFIIKLTMPRLYQIIMQLLQKPKFLSFSDLRYLLFNSGLFTTFKFSSFIGIILILSIVLGGFDLSNNDLDTAKKPFSWLCLLILIILAILELLGLGTTTRLYLLRFAKFFTAILSVSFTAGLIVNIVLYICNLF